MECLDVWFQSPALVSAEFHITVPGMYVLFIYGEKSFTELWQKCLARIIKAKECFASIIHRVIIYNTDSVCL